MNVLSDLSAITLILLVLISLIGGIGITAIGPGGVLVTIALFLLTDLTPAEVAGTAIVTHIGTGIVGSLAYIRSGQLREPPTRRLAVIFGIAAAIGTPLGVWLNTRMSSDIFGVLLAMLVMLVGTSVLIRERRRPRRTTEDAQPSPGARVQAMQGGGIALVSGIFGIGGPMISVPIMVLVGLPLLQALAVAQAQSIVIASAGALTYYTQGVISWPLVILTGAPQLAGVWIGWKIAHALPRRPLTYTLAATLILLGPVIIMMR